MKFNTDVGAVDLRITTRYSKFGKPVDIIPSLTEYNGYLYDGVSFQTICELISELSDDANLHNNGLESFIFDESLPKINISVKFNLNKIN